MRKIILIPALSLLLLLIGSDAFSQFTLGYGKANLEITGATTMYFNYRIQKSPTDSKANNLFSLRDAQIGLEGRYGRAWKFQFQADIADMIKGSSDPENPGLMDANATWMAPKYFSIQGGYGKVPYSRANMVPFFYSPFFSRAEIAGGAVFARRDAGVTLQGKFYKQLLNVYFGVYTGMGEGVIKLGNDRGGKPEYIARVDFSYPIRNRYEDFDRNNSPVPSFCVGVNARYTEKTNSVIDNYTLAVIGGKKYTYGAELSVKYHGLSLQGEIHQLTVYPTDSTRLGGYDTKYFRAGGYYVQLSYYCRPAKMAAALRFDELNQTDLQPGYGRRLTAGLCYFPRGYNTMIRFNYTHILSEENVPGYSPGKWTDQFRLGFQYLFR